MTGRESSASSVGPVDPAVRSSVELYELDRAGDRQLPPAYAWTAHAATGLRYHDWFCGAGGSSLGMTAAGLELAVAANHWRRAIETHAANFPHAEHVCADLTHYDLRLAPPAEVLWASPICTESSPAGGRRRGRGRGGQVELELFGPVAKEGMERTRATFWEVIRSTELFRYRAVIVENVVDVAAEWPLFDYWLQGMDVLGYVVQFVSVSSAHIGGPANPHAPQWRDRLYMVYLDNPSCQWRISHAGCLGRRPSLRLTARRRTVNLADAERYAS